MIINPNPMWILPPGLLLDSKVFGLCSTLFDDFELEDSEQRPKPDFSFLKKANSEVLASIAANDQYYAIYNQIQHSKSEIIRNLQVNQWLTHIFQPELLGFRSRDSDYQHRRKSPFSCVSNLNQKTKEKFN